MKTNVLKEFLFVIALFVSVFANSQTFNLIWTEEFDQGENILPNSIDWKNEVGGPIRNNEWQYYTDRDIDNQVIRDGKLLIIGKKEDYQGMKYTSASLVTKSSWKYGRIESKFKMQTGMGVWACFWTLANSSRAKGNSWPRCGEIDILEHLNNEVPFSSTVHWWKESLSGPNKHIANGGEVPKPIGDYNPNVYNVYAIEWTPKDIKWFLNDSVIKTVSILNGVDGMYEFHEPHFILLNCPIGGDWPSIRPGWNASQVVTVDTMFVDYVKVYSFQSGNPAAPTNLSISAISQTGCNLTWAVSTGATGYDVIIDDCGTIKTYGPFTDTNCVITELSQGKTYAARVKSRNSVNNSDLSEMSEPVFFTTLPASIPTPLINMQFNENSGLKTANSGSVGGSFEFFGSAAWSTNRPANNSAGTGSIEISTTSDVVQFPNSIDQISGLNDITITGWLNCKNSTETGGSRVLSSVNVQFWNASIGTGGIDLATKSDGSLQLGINESVGATASRSSAGMIPVDANASTSNWKFFAATYSATTKSVSFYFGTNSKDASLDKTVTYNRGSILPYYDAFSIGNLMKNNLWLKDRNFKGLIDQIQIYNSSLTLSQIIAVQNIGTTALSDEKIDSQKLHIYPSPAKDNLTVSFGSLNVHDKVNVSVLNLNGCIVYQQTSIDNSTFTIPLNNFANGIYFIKVQTNKETLIRKFIVAK